MNFARSKSGFTEDVISLFVCSWHPPSMMDAVLATICGSGQAIGKKNE